MTRLLPAPLISLLLFLMWPVLNDSWSQGHLLLGAALALAIPCLTDALRAERPRLSQPLAIARLTGVVMWDIVQSNIDVAKRILGPEAAIKPGFVKVPLSIRDPHGIATLATIITMTPGTLSADLDAERSHLLIHAFNLDDEAALIDAIKTRYEAPLMRIFSTANQ